MVCFYHQFLINLILYNFIIMAEIKIERKKPIWPWILVILVVLGIVAYFVYTNGDNTDYNNDFVDEVSNEQVTEPTSRSSRYDEYSAFDESIRDSTRVAVDSSYTKKAFSNLAKAVVKTADENNVEDSKALTGLREWSVLLTGISTTKTDMENFKNFKTACDKVAKVLGDVQVKNFPELKEETDRLEQLASNVSPSIAMNEQQTALNAFLRKSRDVLNAMNP